MVPETQREARTLFRQLPEAEVEARVVVVEGRLPGYSFAVF